MSQPSLSIKISFESLVDAISHLSVQDKQKLWEILDNQLNLSPQEDDYDWGIEGQPTTKTVQYIPQEGLTVIGDKNDPS